MTSATEDDKQATGNGSVSIRVSRETFDRVNETRRLLGERWAQHGSAVLPAGTEQMMDPISGTSLGDMVDIAMAAFLHHLRSLDAPATPVEPLQALINDFSPEPGSQTDLAVKAFQKDTKIKVTVPVASKSKAKK